MYVERELHVACSDPVDVSGGADIRLTLPTNRFLLACAVVSGRGATSSSPSPAPNGDSPGNRAAVGAGDARADPPGVPVALNDPAAGDILPSSGVPNTPTPMAAFATPVPSAPRRLSSPGLLSALSCSGSTASRKIFEGLRLVDSPSLSDSVMLLLRGLVGNENVRRARLDGLSGVQGLLVGLGARTPSHHGCLGAMTVTRGRAGIERPVVVEHFGYVRDTVRGRTATKRQNHALGPTPEKSSLSMTSAWEEPFFLVRLDLPLSMALAARATES